MKKFLVLGFLSAFFLLSTHSYAQWNGDCRNLPGSPTCPALNEDNDTQLTFHFIYDPNNPDRAYDDSPNSNNGTIFNAVWSPDHDPLNPNPNDKSLHFANPWGYVLVPNSDSLSTNIEKAIKIDFFVNFDSLPCTQPPPPLPPVPCIYSILQKGDSYGVYLAWYPPGQGQIIPSGVWQFVFFTNDGPVLYCGFYGLFDFGTWYHVECTFDGGAKKLFVNGELKVYTRSHASYSTTAGGKNIIPDSSPLVIGWFPGYIDELRIYNKAKIEAVKLVVDNDNPDPLTHLWFKNIFFDPDSGLWKTKDHVFLVGHGQREDLFMWENQDYREVPQGSAPMSALTYLQILSEYNLNYCRTDVTDWNTWQKAEIYPLEYPIPECAYERDAISVPPPGEASDGCDPFKITRKSAKMNDDYLTNRLQCFTKWARNRGIFLEYTLFDGWTLDENRPGDPITRGWNRSLWKTPPDQPSLLDPPKNGKSPPYPGPLELDNGIKNYEIYSDGQEYFSKTWPDNSDADNQCDTVTTSDFPCSAMPTPPPKTNDTCKKLCWLWWVQTGLIKVIVDEVLYGYENYILEICNEHFSNSPNTYGAQPGANWTQKMVQYIADKYTIRPRLKSIDRARLGGTYYVPWCAECDNTQSDKCDIIDVHFNPSPGSIGGLTVTRNTLLQLNDNSPTAERTKPRINNENYDAPSNDIWPSKVAWTTFVGGGHYQRHNGDWRSGSVPEEELKDFEALKRFVHNTYFWELKPVASVGSFFSVDYPGGTWFAGAMQSARPEYVLYIAVPHGLDIAAGTIRVILSVQQGLFYHAEWFLPEQPPFPEPTYLNWTGSFKYAGEVQSGDPLLVPGFKDHIALHLWVN